MAKDKDGPANLPAEILDLLGTVLEWLDDLFG